MPHAGSFIFLQLLLALFRLPLVISESSVSSQIRSTCQSARGPACVRLAGLGRVNGRILAVPSLPLRVRRSEQNVRSCQNSEYTITLQLQQFVSGASEAKATSWPSCEQVCFFEYEAASVEAYAQACKFAELQCDKQRKFGLL